MYWLLFLIPVLTVASGLALYHKNGRREFLMFDVVQFVYAFILAPIFFVWFKSFLFYLLRRELDLNLTLTGLFVVDTIYSVISMFIYAFMVIHSLTKSFENKRYKDPLFDFFKDSESLHLWVSHLAIYGGVMVLISILSTVNLFSPLTVQLNKLQFYGMLSIGVMGGVAGFVAVWLSIFKERFWRVLRLMFAVFFIGHVVMYFWVDPPFRPEYLMFWFTLIMFATFVGMSFVFERSSKTVYLFEKLSHKKGWSAKKKRFLLSK